MLTYTSCKSHITIRLCDLMSHIEEKGIEVTAAALPDAQGGCWQVPQWGLIQGRTWTSSWPSSCPRALPKRRRASPNLWQLPGRGRGWVCRGFVKEALWKKHLCFMPAVLQKAVSGNACCFTAGGCSSSLIKLGVCLTECAGQQPVRRVPKCVSVAPQHTLCISHS